MHIFTYASARIFSICHRMKSSTPFTEPFFSFLLTIFLVFLLLLNAILRSNRTNRILEYLPVGNYGNDDDDDDDDDDDRFSIRTLIIFIDDRTLDFSSIEKSFKTVELNHQYDFNHNS